MDNLWIKSLRANKKTPLVDLYLFDGEDESTARNIMNRRHVLYMLKELSPGALAEFTQRKIVLYRLQRNRHWQPVSAAGLPAAGTAGLSAMLVGKPQHAELLAGIDVFSYLPSGYVPDGLLKSSSRTVSVFRPVGRRAGTERGERLPAAVILNGGYGDIVLAAPLLRSFICDHHAGGMEVRLVTNNAGAGKMLETFIPGAGVDVLPYVRNRMAETVLQSGAYSEAYNLNVGLPLSPPAPHITELWSSCLAVSPSSIHLQHSWEPPPIARDLLRLCEQMRERHDFVVTAHFASLPQAKVWPAKQVLAFLSLCKANRIGVLYLDQVPGTDQEHVCNLGSLPLEAIVSIIARADLHIGIDSVFGHIAGIAGIPSLTLWGPHDPLHVHTSAATYCVSYRVIRKNYSLVPVSRSLASIPARVAGERMLQILHKGIKLQTDLISMVETRRGVGIEYIL